MENSCQRNADQDVNILLFLKPIISMKRNMVSDSLPYLPLPFNIVTQCHLIFA